MKKARCQVSDIWEQLQLWFTVDVEARVVKAPREERAQGGLSEFIWDFDDILGGGSGE